MKRTRSSHLAALVIGAHCLCGCRTVSEFEEYLARENPEFVQLVGPGFYRLSEPDQRALQHIAYATIGVDYRFQSNLLTILASPVVERPEFWVTLVNDTARSDVFRRNCLEAFFLRHLRPGDELGKLARIVGTNDWFEEDTISAGGILNGLPFDSDFEDTVYVFRPALMSRAGGWVVFAVKGGKVGKGGYAEQESEMLNVLNGRESNRRLIVTQVAVN